MRVKNLITIKQGLGEGQAVFWLMRRGDAKVCGRPMLLKDFTDTWNEPRPDYALYHWGVNLLPSCPFDVQGVYNHCQALWAMRRFWRQAHGSLNLKNITKRGILDRHLFTDTVRVQLPARRTVIPGGSYWLEPDGSRDFISETRVIDSRTLQRLQKAADELGDMLD